MQIGVLQVEPSPTTGMPYPPPLFQTQGTNTEQAASFAAGAVRPWSGAGRGPTPATRKEVSTMCTLVGLVTRPHIA